MCYNQSSLRGPSTEGNSIVGHFHISLYSFGRSKLHGLGFRTDIGEMLAIADER